MFRIITFGILVTLTFAAPPRSSSSSSAQKKGIFDDLYDEFDLLDEVPLNTDNRDYEIIYDTRQKGEENYRLHVDGVEVLFGEEPQVNSDLLGALEAMYGMGMGGGGMNEETLFTIGGGPLASTTKKEEKEKTTTSKPLMPSVEEINDKKEMTEKPLAEASTTKKTEEVTKEPPKTDISSLKRNTDFIKRRFKISDVVRSFFHNKRFTEHQN